MTTTAHKHKKSASLHVLTDEQVSPGDDPVLDQPYSDIDADSIESDTDNAKLPELKGVLCKWTNYLHGWQERYIVLKEATLSYFRSADDTAVGCRGAISVGKAVIVPHKFDECRFDVNVNDSVWYLRAASPEERQHWVDCVELHKQAESGYSSINSMKLRRQGSLVSVNSVTSFSQASQSSARRGGKMLVKLEEMGTYKDILVQQVEALQTYFDACADAIQYYGTVHDLPDDEDQDDDSNKPVAESPLLSKIVKNEDLMSIFNQHGAHALDFRGQSLTFKATTGALMENLQYCIEMFGQKEDFWKRKLEREQKRRRKVEDAYKELLACRKQTIDLSGPDFMEGPHSLISDDQFYDAVDAALDKFDDEEDNKLERIEKVRNTCFPPKQNIDITPGNRFYDEITAVTESHLSNSSVESCGEGWDMIHEEGPMKVYRREYEEDGLVLDPLKAVHIVEGVTAREVCNLFWDPALRMETDANLESCNVLEWLAKDTVICHQVMRKTWPVAQRDMLFWSHIREIACEDENSNTWVVINHSTDHPDAPNKYIRVNLDVALLCSTILEPGSDDDVSRKNVKCKVSYIAEVNPGGWAPSSALRQVYKREYPKFLKRFTDYVKEKVKDRDIMF